jgi:hypothetical protein
MLKSEGRRELKPRQQQDALPQAPVLGELLGFFRREAAERLEQFVLLDFLLHLAVTGNRVVIGESGQFESARLAAAQHIEVPDIRFLEIGGGGGMDVKIHDRPTALPGTAAARVHGCAAGVPGPCP